MNVGPVVENQRTTGLLDMETAHPVALVDEHVRIRQLTQIVRTLPNVDDMRKAGNEPHQAWRIAFHRLGIMQHDAESVQTVTLQKAGQRLKASLFLEPQRGQIAIENQYLVFGQGQNRIAGLTIRAFAGE